MQKRISLQQNLINHVGFVLDGSGSMRYNEKALIAATDELIDVLKERSQANNQETRATIYIFGRDTQAACYDIDVLRTPSIKELYEATGSSTSLIDATLMAIREMKQTAVLHGDHAFLLYVLTDGQENSSKESPDTLRGEMQRLPIEWTVAALVPDRQGQRAAVSYGFELENTMIWDATSPEGVEEVSYTISAATSNYMDMRSTGVRGTKNLFTLDPSLLTTSNVKINLDEVPPSDFQILKVKQKTPIKQFVEDNVRGGKYRVGSTYYELTKPEEIQPQKNIALRDLDGKIFRGVQARQLLGLPDSYSVKVSPIQHPKYNIFVQSTSSNRALVPNTSVIVFR